ncbi:MAG: hypothetical protein U0231_02410 [Nitrospiraceae bacterium]
MIQQFAAMLRSQQADHPGCIAIVVSEEAKDYRPEMVDGGTAPRDWVRGVLRRAEGGAVFGGGPVA